jgi:hypothetical protein
MEIVKAGAEEVLAEKEIQQTCQNEMSLARANFNYGRPLPEGGWMGIYEECVVRMESEVSDGGESMTEAEKALEAADQEMEIVKAGAEEVLAEKEIQQACSREFQVAVRPGGKLYPSTKEYRVLKEFMNECLPRMESELANEDDSANDVEKAVEAAEQEIEIVKAGAEEVLAEREIMEAAQVRCRRDSFNPNNLKGKSRGAFLADCLREATANSGGSGDIDSDVEKAVEAAEQEIEIVKAGAEQVVEEKAMVEDLQHKCLREYNSPENRYSLGGMPRLSINQFMTECMDEGSKDLAVLGDIDSDIEKAVEEAEQEMEIVKAGAEEVFEERVSSLEEKVAELIELLKEQ